MTYALLKPTQVPKLDKSQVNIISYEMRPYVVHEILSQIPANSIVAVDIETKGTQAADVSTRIVGVGVSWDLGTHYFDIETNASEVNDELIKFLLRTDLTFLGHNIFFDAAFLTRDIGTWMNWQWDTFGLFRQLASEGWIGQKYGLKDAQVHLLGWDSKGDEELNEYLVKQGLVNNAEVYTAEKWTPELRYQGYLDGKVRPNKGEMWQAPATILGYYCGLDAYSTLQLFKAVLYPVIVSWPESWQEVFCDYHSSHIQEIKLLVEQQLRGIRIDTNILDTFDIALESTIAKSNVEFLKHPEISRYLAEYNLNYLSELKSGEPAKYKKLPVLGEEPSRLTKKGEASGAWLKWEAKRLKIQELGPGEISKVWLNWAAKYDEAAAVAAKGSGHFNINSGPQRRWLFYDKLQYEVKVKTKSDQPATDKKALPGFGEPGRILNKLDKQVKLTTFVESLRARLLNGQLHPQFTVPGTFTGRLGGSGKFNLQNIPKSYTFASAFRARPGHVWVDLDFASLEQVVLAELSRDPTLLKLYGPGAPANDVYLFNGSQLPVIGDKIRKAGYDPNNPTVEGIESAKKLAKRERGIAKTITLASAYGAGANKIRMTLALEGVFVGYKEAEAMVKGYWNLYGKVKEYEAYLQDEWEHRGGWVFNGLGRPVCCFFEKRKDLVNRVVQSTGHDILMLFIRELAQQVQGAGIEAWPVFLDTHDATTWECREQDAELLKQAFEKSLQLTNEWLMGENGLIPLKGDATIVTNLAEAKGLKDE